MGRPFEGLGLKKPADVFVENAAMIMLNYIIEAGMDDAISHFTDIPEEELQIYPFLSREIHKAKEKNEHLEDIDEKLRHIPHVGIIKENGRTVIPSIFMFKESSKMWEFLYAAKKMNSLVFFENEHLAVYPDDRTKEVELMPYITLIDCHKGVGDYLRYMVNIEKMKWEDEQEQGE